MKIIGITGGVGAGKTTVVDTLLRIMMLFFYVVTRLHMT